MFKDKENQRPTPELTPSSSAGSGFVTEPNSVGNGPSNTPGLPLFTLPQNHPHAQGSRSGNVPTTNPRTVQQSSRTSRNLLPTLPLPPAPRSSGSSTGSSSSLSPKKRDIADKRTSTEHRASTEHLRGNTEELVKKYTPSEYTPASQRNFYKPNEQPTLVPKNTTNSIAKQRPKSAYIPSLEASTGHSADSPRRTSLELREGWEKKRPDASKDGSGSSSSKNSSTSSQGSLKSEKTGAGLDLAGIDIAFEALLDSRGVPTNMRDRMRSLDIRVKQEFIRKEAQMEKSAEKNTASFAGMGIFGKRPQTSHNMKTEARPKSSKGLDVSPPAPPSPVKKARPRSRTFVGTSREKEHSSTTTAPSSPAKKKTAEVAPPLEKSMRVKGVIFPPVTAASAMNNGPTPQVMVATLIPEEWVEWLEEAGIPKNMGNKMFAEDIDGKGPSGSGERGMKDVEVAKLHKLRLILRNERLKWVEKFVELGGMQAVWGVLERVLGVEWREEHEDMLLHELLLCLKALCTATSALRKLLDMEETVFPRLIELLFDEEKKGPSEFTTRGLIIQLLFTHLSTATVSQRPERARRILEYLADKLPNEDKRPIEFIEAAHTRRPYKRWCKEVVNVTKEVFWIFLHGTNVIPLPTSYNPASERESYISLHFPAERPPVPAAPYVGGVEWEATNYLANHLDLLNACIASLETREQRNNLRLDLRNSGWEKALGGSLRTCKEKLHTALHEGLKTWVAAAAADDWEVADVRFGPRFERVYHHKEVNDKEARRERRKKKELAQQQQQEELKVELPRLSFDQGNGGAESGEWLY
ncbi:uncharacterized protein LAJ45_06539 [Morchella importuna]|nr:uncharacterized protein LAJ45_06539 [Morchella importuna]KAH8149459.1 hypothetical protein LAJ45_06539 [Morchella importuna]